MGHGGSCCRSSAVVGNEKTFDTPRGSQGYEKQNDVIEETDDTDAIDSIGRAASRSLRRIDTVHEHGVVEEMHACGVCCSLMHLQCCNMSNTSSQSSKQPPTTCGSCNMEGAGRSIHCVSAAAMILLRRQVVVERLKHKTMSDDERQAQIETVDQAMAQKALDLILDLKGYYIKAAQTLCGAGQLPPEMEEAFGVLLDQCPKEPFDVVKRIVEDELGCRLTDVFAEFDEVAIAAASIGQVHFATLLNGTKVAVKVQYPSVEKFFRMDIQMVSMATRLAGMGAKVKKVFEVMEEQFAQEFDYTKEARVMRQVSENVMPHYKDKVVIPLPIDDKHPFLSQQSVVKTLCTRKVLTMEKLDGKPIKEYTQQMLEIFASIHGTTAEELKKQMNMKDPTKVDTENKAIKAALNMGEVSQNQSRMLRVGVKVRNLCARIIGGSMGCCCVGVPQPQWVKKQLVEPLDGPKLARILFEVHGHEMFQNGLFNSDPHAGNVLMQPDGRLGLIDYGAVMSLSEEQRTNIAKLLIAIADEDDESVPPAFHACGFRSKKQDYRLALLLAHVFFNRGPFPYDMNRLAPKVGMPRDASIMDLDGYIRGGKLDDIEEFPGHLVMLQRCCMVLSGIGMELGAGRLSSAGMLKPQAIKWLERRKSA